MRRNSRKNGSTSENKKQRPVPVPLESQPANTEPNLTHPTEVLRNQRPSFLTKFCGNLSSFKYVIIALFIPPLLNFGALQRETNALLPKGEKVDMGWGQKMYVHCEGEGLPAVILDSPTGLTSDIWLFVQKQLMKTTMVCVYDRSGLGNSDPIFNEITPDNLSSQNRGFVGQPHTLDQMTSDLHYLLNHVKHLPHPFIIVGSDIGALIARMYSIIYPVHVSDIVLIDPLVETLFTESQEWKDYWFSKLLPYYESLHLSALVGVSRVALLLGLLQPVYFQKHIPEELMFWQKSLLCNPRHMNSVFYEHLFMNSTFSQMRDIWTMKPFPASISVSVIARENPVEFPHHLHQAWKQAQQHLVENLHTNCNFKTIKNPDLLDLYSQPSSIVSTVEAVVKKWRNRPTSFSFHLPSEASS